MGTDPTRLTGIHGQIWDQRIQEQLIRPLSPQAQIMDKFHELGGQAVLGAPTGDVTPTPDRSGYYQHFQNGWSIYWSSQTGAQEVHGAIRDKWGQLGWERGLGYPKTDESGTPDGVGRFNHFQRGSIYWTPATGAHEVHGAILAHWAALGWERSYLGYPISDELPLPDGNGRYSNFQKGQIAWSPSLGAAVSATSFHPQHGGGIRPLGLTPSGTPEVRRRVVIKAHIAVTDDETFGANEHADGDQSGEAVITNQMPQELITMVQTCGGEVRIELRLDARATEGGDVLVTGKALLYEGTSEQTDDLDGQESVNFLAPRDNFTHKSYTVRNQDEGGDFAEITMTVSNHAA